MRIELIFFSLLAAAHVHVQPTPEMSELKAKMADLDKQMGALGKQFETGNIWQDQSKMMKLTDKLEDLTKKLEPLEKQYHHLKKAAKQAQKEAAAKEAALKATEAKPAPPAVVSAAPVASQAPAVASKAPVASAPAKTVADEVAITPQKILLLLAAAAESAPKPTPTTAPESPIQKLQDKIEELKKKLDTFGKDFGKEENYSSSKNIQDLVGKIEDTQIKMSKDYEKLDKLKKAAKKAAKAEAAKKAAEAKAAEEKAKEEAAKKAATSSTAAPKAASPKPSTSEAPAYTKQPLMLVATDTEPSMGLWWFVISAAVVFSAFYACSRSKILNTGEIRPLLQREEYYQCAA